MNSLEVLCRLTDRQIDSLFRVARELPQDKLDWKPTLNNRSALDQLQEVATALNWFWEIFTKRKMDWSDEKMQQWVKERSLLTSLDELEKACRESTKKLTDYIRTLDEKDLSLPVEMPFPGEFTLVDVLSYHYWNASYHEGQITYISQMLS